MAAPVSEGSVSDVCTTTAASHAAASAFLMPNEESGSMNDAASPTSAHPGPANIGAT